LHLRDLYDSVDDLRLGDLDDSLHVFNVDLWDFDQSFVVLRFELNFLRWLGNLVPLIGVFMDTGLLVVLLVVMLVSVSTTTHLWPGARELANSWAISRSRTCARH